MLTWGLFENTVGDVYLVAAFVNFHTWINLKNEPNKMHNHYLVWFGLGWSVERNKQ